MTAQEVRSKITELLTNYAKENSCSVNINAQLKRIYSDLDGVHYSLSRFDIELEVV